MRANVGARLAALALAGLSGVTAAVLIARTSPPPSADVSRGSEDAFVRGLHAREIPPRGKPQRWTRERAVASFRHLPAGPAQVEVELRGQKGPVVVAADGVVLGTLDAGARRATFDVPAGPRPLREVELRGEAFRAGDGRQLGALLERITVRVAPSRPSLGLIAAFALPALLTTAFALLAGSPPWMAGTGAVAMTLLQAAVLRPSGVAFSPYAFALAALIGGAAAAGGIWGLFWERRRPGAGRWAFVALLCVFVVQVVIGASPLMVVSDAVFHGNNLMRVAGGDLFLTSMTQHATPFRFPYGVSFYVVLAPLLRTGADPVALVRWGAALAGVGGALALFTLLATRGPALAALAVVLMQLMPGTVDVLSFGNLSNAFAQGLTLLFFAWWAGRAGGTWVAGALLLALAAIAHLSSFIVLAVLCPWLAWAHWPELKRDRTRVLALLVGLGAAVAYFASFAGLVMGQVARLGEGGGSAGQGIVASLARQGMSVMGQWGLPVLALAILGLPLGSEERLDRDLWAWWKAGVALLVLAVVTPLDVRWVYALAGAAAAAAATGFSRRWASGWLTRGVGLALLALQAGLAAWSGAFALWARYR